MSYDLTKVGPVREDVQVMVRDECNDSWEGPFLLLAIDKSYDYPYKVWSVNSVVLMFGCAKLYEPPVKRPMTHPEIFKAIREGAVVNLGGRVYDSWDTGLNRRLYKICYNYTDTEADVWEEMEVDGE